MQRLSKLEEQHAADRAQYAADRSQHAADKAEAQEQQQRLWRSIGNLGADKLFILASENPQPFPGCSQTSPL